MVLEPLIKDFPEQFKTKEKIGILTRAFDRQLKELEEVFDQIRVMTTLDYAVGKQLDYAGDIVGLTRAEAGLLCGDEIFFDIIDDDRYRQYLKYKAYKNSNKCTYYDLINQLQMVWNAGEIGYEEDPDYPATIIVTASLLTPEGGPADISFVPSVHPAGVGFLYRYRLKYVIQVGKELTLWAYEQPMCGQVVCGVFPTVSTLGNSLEEGIEVSNAHAEQTKEYDLTGTYPETATLGKSHSNEIVASAASDLDSNEYGYSGDGTDTGTFPERTALGYSADTEVDASASSEVEKSDYDIAGTIPQNATIGTTQTEQIEASSKVETTDNGYIVVGIGASAGITPDPTEVGIQSQSNVESSELKSVTKTTYLASGEAQCGKYF